MTEIRPKPFMPPSRAEFAADQRKSLIRALTGVAFSSQDRSAEAYVAASWPNDHFAGMIAKAAVTPISTASGLPSVVAVNVLPSLAPMSAAVRLFAKCRRVNLDGISQVFVPRGVPGPTRIFIAEGAPSPGRPAQLDPEQDRTGAKNSGQHCDHQRTGEGRTGDRL